jgi:hypothetical protein
MNTSYSNQKFNSKTLIYFTCDNCKKEGKRRYLTHLDIKSRYKSIENKDFCYDCWNKIRQTLPESREKMSNDINKMIESDPDWKNRNSISKKGKINIGDSNPMKNPDARKKQSISRKIMLSDPENRKKISDNLKQAWIDGKYDGVKVGCSKWYDYVHSNGTTYKVQGTWELEFIKWLDENNLNFNCHKGRLEYILNGEKKSYYPDFFVEEWNQYVDIKNDYHYSISTEKFEALKNQGYDIKLIFKTELEQLINKKL